MKYDDIPRKKFLLLYKLLVVKSLFLCFRGHVIFRERHAVVGTLQYGCFFALEDT